MAKVLVVDDEPGYLEHLRWILEDEGHEVATAENGESAVEIGQGLRPDVLVADWALKGRLNGLDVARTLQADIPGLVTIVITGYSAADVAAGAGKMKDLRVLEKPFDSDAFRDLVRQVAPPTKGQPP